MKPQEFEALLKAKTPVVESTPEPIAESVPAPVLQPMDLNAIDQQYHALLGESNLNEFAPGEGGSDFMGYIKALAHAWYTHDIRMLKDIIKKGGSPMKKIIDAQVAVEKMLNRGIHCPDGKVRKYYIDYDSEFLGVDIVSHDFYEHTDYGPDERGLKNVEIDDRTGKPWGPYEHFEFKGHQLGEGVEEAMMAGGSEAYAMEDEQLDGMALGELKAIAQAAKKIYTSVKQGVPLEAWMYKKITNGNEGLTAVAQQIDNPAVREHQGMAESSSQSRLQPGTQVMLWLGPRDMLPNPPRDDKKYWDKGVVVSEPEMMTGSWQVLVKSQRAGQSPISPERVFVLRQQGVAEGDVVAFKRPVSQPKTNQQPQNYHAALELAGDWFWLEQGPMAHEMGTAKERKMQRLAAQKLVALKKLGYSVDWPLDDDDFYGVDLTYIPTKQTWRIDADNLGESMQGVAEGYNPVESDWARWSEALYPDGDGAYALELVGADAGTIKNILTYVKQNRQVLAQEVGDRINKTVKDAIVDIGKAYPELYQAAQQPQGVADDGRKQQFRATGHGGMPPTDDDGNPLHEMDSQPPQGRIKSDGTRSHSTYGSRDGHSITGPDLTAKTTTPKKVIKKGTDILDRAFKDADKKDPNDPNWSKKYSKDVAEGQLDEIKQRLDPKCWKGKHKEGTKIKGGVRVNNCVPNESTDYAAQVNSLLNEFAGGMGAGSVASAPGRMQNPAKVGSLFGGSYSPKSPFKKKPAKKKV